MNRTHGSHVLQHDNDDVQLKKGEIMKKIFIASLLLAFVVPAANAASLQNKDSSSYDIRVKGNSTSTGSINGGTIKNNICSSCDIEVKGVGSVSISGSDKAVIKNGNISVH
ncbi:MAG: hypothetical protein Q9M14_05470 [Mariprofundaceae bacterium]|nr:hypothetical protein [Mariprofundaceae bacterium]